MSEEKEIKTGNKYWSWKKGKRKDNWEWLKKSGRKRGSVITKSKDELEVAEAQVSSEIGVMVNYLSFWKTKIEHPENKEEGVKPWVPLTITQACREYWIHPNTFYNHLNKFPALKQKYFEIKENNREYIRSMSENNVQRAIAWKIKWLSDKDVLDASFKMLERTDKAYNPKIEIEKKELTINVDVSWQDLKNELFWLLWIQKTPESQE